MKNNVLLLTALLILMSISVSAQRAVLSDAESVQAAVVSEINGVLSSPGFLKQKNKKFPDVKGTVTVDVGVYRNGKVSSFFKVDSDIKNIDFLNFMSDYILGHKFNFKLPKQQKYKVRYTAKI
ncbi:MAG: hypothetical protein IR153_09905 [Flavobacterium sp.]|nr:hypothetical protein [Flavobacterium sp.]